MENKEINENDEVSQKDLDTSNVVAPYTENTVPNRGTTPTYMRFVSNQRKVLTYIGFAVLALIAGITAYRYFYLNPLENEGRTAIFAAQRYFEADSFNLALNGDGKNVGFADASSDYGMTKTGNLAEYYAGIALLQQGKYEDAIDHLKDFNTDSKILKPMALGAIGDAYSQLKEYDNAADYYMKAAKDNENDFTTPRFYKKAGMVYEQLGKFDDAVSAYQIIKDKYKTTQDGTEIEKYLARASAAANQD
jgi:tetratricopeptide (TPR) repeat protein